VSKKLDPEEKKRRKREQDKRYRESHKVEAAVYSKQYRLLHKEEKKIADKVYREAHRQQYRQYNKKYYYKNLDAERERHRIKSKNTKGYPAVKRHRSKYPGLSNFYNMLRAAAKLKATPKWLTEEQLYQLEQIYRNCPKGYAVDHIVPLRGKNVRGLHVPWNLQYLTKKENSIKNNKFDGTYENNTWRVNLL
jgi:5-methylcytosine-specific restriction endonuclease McrA